VQLTSFVGRAVQLRALESILIAEHDHPHLVTLTGAGGTGKTRLALEAAARLLGCSAFPDGVYFVALAALGDSALVAPTIAHALGVSEAAARPLDTAIIAHLRSRRILLILDNLEHLPSASLLVATLLEHCPRLRVLVTSRVPLHVYGEREVPVPPLSVADSRRLPALEHLANSEAVALFVARAADVAADFTLTQENAAAVAGICARLEGLPLALELAASRCKVLPPQAILARLDRRLALLAGGARTLPARHQTLRAAIAWSHDLLPQAEQILFRRLAIFTSGCTLAAAGAVCMAPDLLPSLDLDPLDGVGVLVDHSLLRRDPTQSAEAEPRFLMLETIREYALEHLAMQGEIEALGQQHARYYAGLAAQVAPHLSGRAAMPALQHLEREGDNLRGALEWLVAAGEAAAALRLAGALAPCWLAQGQYGEGRMRLAAVLALPGAAGQTAERASVLAHAGALAQKQGDLPAARALLEESLALWRLLGDQQGIARLLCELGDALFNLGQSQAAHALLDEGITLWRALDDQGGLAHAYYLLSYLLLAQGERAAARALLEESVRLQGTPDDHGRAREGVGLLGVIALEEGEYERARTLLSENYAGWQQAGDLWMVNLLRINLARLATAEGDPFAARELLAESTRYWRDTSVTGEIPELALQAWAWLAAVQGEGRRALRLLGAAGVLGVTTPGHGQMPAACERALEHACRDLSTAERAYTMAEGRGMALAAAFAFALEEASPP
jgi:predicted ATPase